MTPKTKAQTTGGRLLAHIKKQLINAAKPGIKLEVLDHQAESLLKQTGGQPSFQMVPGYSWATCINLNSGIVHGIPKGVIQDGDLVTIDIGLFYKGFHTDTSTSFIAGTPDPQILKFLQVGQKVLQKAIAEAKPGNRVWDISYAIQKGIESAGYSVVRNLTGHGVAQELHQEPTIPCFTRGNRSNSPLLENDQSLAIEVMYCQGNWHTITDSDGWTITTADQSLSAVFEETIILTKNKPLLITAIS